MAGANATLDAPGDLLWGFVVGGQTQGVGTSACLATFLEGGFASAPIVCTARAAVSTASQRRPADWGPSAGESDDQWQTTAWKAVATMTGC